VESIERVQPPQPVGEEVLADGGRQIHKSGEAVRVPRFHGTPDHEVGLPARRQIEIQIEVARIQAGQKAQVSLAEQVVSQSFVSRQTILAQCGNSGDQEGQDEGSRHLPGVYRVSKSETNRGSKLRLTSTAPTVRRLSAATGHVACAAPPTSCA
jgi:hypothetical protein